MDLLPGVFVLFSGLVNSSWQRFRINASNEGLLCPGAFVFLEWVTTGQTLCVASSPK